MLKRFAHYFKPHKKMFFLDLFCALIVAVCDLFYPMVAKDIINVYVPERNLRLLIVWSLVLLGIYLLKLGMNYIVAFFGHMVGVHIQADMRRDLFRHLEKLPFSYYDETKTGSIMSRLITTFLRSRSWRTTVRRICSSASSCSSAHSSCFPPSTYGSRLSFSPFCRSYCISR